MSSSSAVEEAVILRGHPFPTPAQLARPIYKIRDQQPDGSWGPEREVTLAQYRAEIDAKGAAARAIYRANCVAIANATGSDA